MMFKEVIREVSARRARKLRKNRKYCWFARNTENGKARYFWIIRIVLDPTDVWKEAAT
jgi:hypothetical protein